MLKLLTYVTVLLYYFEKSDSHSFIFDKVLNTCSYNSTLHKGGSLKVNSKLWKIGNDNVQIYYTLCGSLPEELNCGVNAAACLKNKKYDSTHSFKKFVSVSSSFKGSKFLLKSSSGTVCDGSSADKYEINVVFLCQEDMQEIHLKKMSECEYVIYMIDPNCSLPCFTSINDQLIDLRELKGNYLCESKERKFSISLCNATADCSKLDRNITVCEKTDGNMVPLSNVNNEKTVYHPQQNEIVYRGSYKGENGVKIFELLLKCGWEDSLFELKYREAEKQGKKYKFIAHSSYGCIKLPPKCVVEDNLLTYNLTNLVDAGGYLVSNVPNGRIYLNVCGPLNLKLKQDNPCSKSFSQVCEIKDGHYVNRGSIVSQFKVDNDIVKMTFANGMRCKEDPSRQYITHIDFICSKTEEGPTFVNDSKCDLSIKWNTPQACPVYDKSKCVITQREQQDCLVNLQRHPFNLSSLKRFSSDYEVVDPKNSSIKYLINICGSFIDPDVSCMQHSMIVMKDMGQPHVKYKFKSLGKLEEISIVNEQIVIQAISGAYCGEEGDYTSKIYLICRDKEEPPWLFNHTKCSFNFLWKTPTACSNKTHPSTTKQCLIEDASGDNVLNFAELKRTTLKIKLNDKYYILDFCKDNYTEYSEIDRYKNVSSLTKRLFSNNGKMFLEMDLQNTCDSKNVADKVIFELICDITERYVYQGDIDNNCIIKLQFHASLICGKEGDIIPVHPAEEREKYDTITETFTERENCTITSPYTGYTVALSSLHINIPIVECPAVLFYEHNTSIILMYPGKNICNTSKDNGSYQYKTNLECSSKEFRDVQKMTCSEVHHVKGTEMCKLFKNPHLDTAPKSQIGIIIFSSVCAVLCVLILCALCIYKRKHHFRRLPYFTDYEKDI